MAGRSGESQPLLASTTVPEPSDDSATRQNKRAALVLPIVVIFYFLSYMTTVIILVPYLYDKVSDEYNFKRNSSSQHPCSNDEGNHTGNATAKEIQDKIQKEVATTELYLGLTGYLAATLSILIVGPLTDKYGRKVGLMFPILGTLFKQVVYAIVIGLNYQPVFLVIGHVCDAFGGSFASMLTSMFSITSDVTTPGRQRSFRIAIMEALQTLTASFGQLALAYWIKVSYFYPLIFGISMSAMAALTSIFLMPETVQVRRIVAPAFLAHNDMGERLRKGMCGAVKSCFTMLKRSFTLYYKDTSRTPRLAKRRLCLAVFILTVAVNFSKPGLQTLYLMKFPLCWSTTKIFTFGAIQIVCNWVVILFLLTLMQRLFKMADRHVAIVGVVSSLVSTVFISLATNDRMVYEVAVLSVMIRAIIPMLRSVMSSLADPNDQGAVYASMGCVETIGAGLFATIANRVYAATVSLWAGAVFIMLAGLNVIALILLVCLNMLFSREARRQAQTQQQGRAVGNPGSIQELHDPSW